MTFHRRTLVWLGLTLLSLSIAACDSGGSDDTDGGTGVDGATELDGGVPPDAEVPPAGFPEGNEWSWNGSWTPTDSDFPLVGLLDDEYSDGHDGTPVLPPGSWDWSDPDNDLANWNNFSTNLGGFDPLVDSTSRQYGWRFTRVSDAVEFRDAASFYEGSSGVDHLHLGRNGSMQSYRVGNLGAGPDILVFDASEEVDFRTGSTMAGGARDDDLVIAGCNPNADGTFDILTTNLHTGPGSDWVFVRDLSDSGIDLGNGEGGRTDTLDALDGDDLVFIRGNTQDFRVFGGQGDDVFVWFVDDNNQMGPALGASFFGGGGWEAALFAENGTDRLVLAVPTDTEIVTASPTPAGALLVRPSEGTLIVDDPTETYEHARHCIECGTGPAGEKTVVFEYESADGSIHSGLFYATGIEEVQVGVGAGARVYTLDAMAGTATPVEDATLFETFEVPAELCD